MSLTPEERQRIYEEEKARIEARSQFVSRQVPSRFSWGNVIGCLVLLGIGLVAFVSCSVSLQHFSKDYPDTVNHPVASSVAQNAVLNTGEDFSLFIYDNPADVAEIRRIQKEQGGAVDTDSGIRLARAMHPVANGTQAIILDTDEANHLTKVRLTTGEFQGREGWVLSSFVH